MKPVLNSLRAFLLAWSLLLTTQVALVHGYAHQQQSLSNASRAATDPEKVAAEQLCSFCVSLSQLGAALPSHHHQTVAGFALPAFQPDMVASVVFVPLALPQARGPPAQS
jgi:hypothetical protein